MNILLADVRIIGTLGQYAIEAGKHEVDLRDGSIHTLHFVRDAAEGRARSLHLRAVRLPDEHWYVVDLRDLASTLGAELGMYLDRDQPGLIKYTLRPLYMRAAELIAKVLLNWKACGSVDQMLEVRAA